MRNLPLLIVLLAGVAGAAAQTPARPQPAPRPQPTPAPAAPRPAPAAQPPAAPRPRAAQPASRRAGVAITVTDPGGLALPNVQVTVLGATERSDVTSDVGQVNFPGMQAGTYRLRFSGDEVISFEREVTLRAGQVADVDVTLNPAPPRPTAPPPPPPAAPAPAAEAVVGPQGQPLALSVLDLLERNFVGTQARRDTLLSCSGNTRTTMIQLNGPLPERLYETAEALYYVIGGEGTVRLGGRDVALTTNSYVSVPRRTLHAFTRTGRRPLILVTVLSGEPCEEPK